MLGPSWAVQFFWKSLVYFPSNLHIHRTENCSDHIQSLTSWYEKRPHPTLETSKTINSSKSSNLHPGRLTWNLQITHLERNMIFQTSMTMFHVNLQGCIQVIQFIQFFNVPRFFLVEPVEASDSEKPQGKKVCGSFSMCFAVPGDLETTAWVVGQGPGNTKNSGQESSTVEMS